MGRVGDKPIPVEDGVKVENQNNQITISGPLGSLTLDLPSFIAVKQEENQLFVQFVGKEKEDIPKQGLFRSLLRNMVEGVTKGYEKKLKLNGVGYRVQMKGKDLEFTLGYSHPVSYKALENISFVVEGQTNLIVKSIDKQILGQTVHEIENLRKYDPYKGKGVFEEGKKMPKKQGKSAKK